MKQMKWTCPHCQATFDLILQMGKKTIIDSCCGVKTLVTKVSNFDFVTELICVAESDHVWKEVKSEKKKICTKCNLVREI